VLVVLILMILFLMGYQVLLPEVLVLKKILGSISPRPTPRIDFFPYIVFWVSRGIVMIGF